MEQDQRAVPLSRDEAVWLLDHPEQWVALPEVKLVALLYFCCLVYGLGSATARIPTLRRLYAIAATRLTAVQRRALLDAAGAFVAAYPDAYRALLPFAFVDTDRRVADAARQMLAALLVPERE